MNDIAAKKYLDRLWKRLESKIDQKIDRVVDELSVIRDFAIQIEKRFNGVEQRLENLEQRLSDVKQIFNARIYGYPLNHYVK